MIMHYNLNQADALEITGSKKMDIIWARIPHSQTPPAKGKSSDQAKGKKEGKG